jgi:hypothetical protein
MAVRAVPTTRCALSPWTPGAVTGLHGLPNGPQHYEHKPKEGEWEQNHVASVARRTSARTTSPRCVQVPFLAAHFTISSHWSRI